MHIKRKTIGNFWPVPKTGDKYMAVPLHEQRSAVPLILVMRDMLKLVKTKKELKKLLNEKKILVNERIVRETNYPVCLFDSVGIPSIKKFYRINLKNKFELVEITEADSGKKIYEIIGKTILPGKKIQLNFNQGRNILTSEKANVGDYALIDLAKNKINKLISLDKGVEVLVIAGKHSGEEGKIKEILTSGDQKVAVIKTHKEEIKSNVKNIFVKEQ